MVEVKADGQKIIEVLSLQSSIDGVNDSTSCFCLCGVLNVNHKAVWEFSWRIIKINVEKIFL